MSSDPIKCDICGRFVSCDDLESGMAIRTLDTPDSDYSTETYDTYHVACTVRSALDNQTTLG
jgi:hypothetical protein